MGEGAVDGVASRASAGAGEGRGEGEHLGKGVRLVEGDGAVRLKRKPRDHVAVDDFDVGVANVREEEAALVVVLVVIEFDSRTIVALSTITIPLLFPISLHRVHVGVVANGAREANVVGGAGGDDP